MLKNVQTQLDSDTIASLVKFVGYGPSKPEVVFLGIEEAGGGPENIAVRAARFKPVEDLFEAHKLLRDQANFSSPYDSHRNKVQAWNTASIFSLAFAQVNCSLWHSLFPSFWRTRLGRKDFETFLMECFPVPRSSIGHSIEGYNPKKLWQDRQHILREFISDVFPKFLIAYGKITHQCLDDIVEVPVWKAVDGTAWSVGISKEGTVVCRVGFFGQGQFNRKDILPIVNAMIGLAQGNRPNLTLP